jgi:hypothetical protein
MFKRFFILWIAFRGFVPLAAAEFTEAPRAEASTRKPETQQKQWKRLQKELRGRLSERVAANQTLAHLGWVPIPKKTDLAKMYKAERLVDLPVNRWLTVNTESIPAHRRITTPGFAKYVRTFSLQLQIPLSYNSGARSIEDQREIAGHNGNAAPIKGKKISAHLYPPAIDWAVDSMPLANRIKFAEFLKAEKLAGRIQVAIEKGKQHCFHVVYLKERPAGPPVFSTKPPAKKAAPKKAAPKKGGRR